MVQKWVRPIKNGVFVPNDEYDIFSTSYRKVLPTESDVDITTKTETPKPEKPNLQNLKQNLNKFNSMVKQIDVFAPTTASTTKSWSLQKPQKPVEKPMILPG